MAAAEETIPRHPRVVSAAIAARLRLGPLGLRRLGRRGDGLGLRAAHQLLDLLDGLPGRAPDVVHQLRDLLFDGAQFVIQGGALPLALEVAVLDRVGVRRQLGRLLRLCGDVGRAAQVNLRIAIEGDGALGVAVRQGLVPLLDQRPMVDALVAASAFKGAVRAVGPSPCARSPGALSCSTSDSSFPKPSGVRGPGGQHDVGVRVLALPAVEGNISDHPTDPQRTCCA